MNFLIVLYACIFLVGILGNGSLGLALCCGPGARTRSPLLLGLITADLLVCGISGPLTAAMYANTSWTQSWGDFAVFVQSWPVSFSTLSMMSISVDRYLTIKNHRPAGQVVRRRNLLNGVVVLTSIAAGVLSGAHLVPKNPLRKIVVLTYLTLAHVTPAVATLASHIGVHAKLTALSLTARAKHGELPLPMPLLRRPTHVIIVAGISKARSGLQKTDGVEDEDIQPPTSTLRSRRRLANSLLWVAVMFALLWLPHTLCQFCAQLEVALPTAVLRYSLLLGHLHSVFSPILYWSLNHQWLNRPCKFRLPPLARSASSTNEAALGPFHPRYVRPPPVRRQSSHYLY